MKVPCEASTLVVDIVQRNRRFRLAHFHYDLPVSSIWQVYPCEAGAGQQSGTMEQAPVPFA